MGVPISGHHAGIHRKSLTACGLGSGASVPPRALGLNPNFLRELGLLLALTSSGGD